MPLVQAPGKPQKAFLDLRRIVAVPKLEIVGIDTDGKHPVGQGFHLILGEGRKPGFILVLEKTRRLGPMQFFGGYALLVFPSGQMRNPPFEIVFRRDVDVQAIL